MKKTLVLSGGGSLGAFQIGVLKHLILDKNHKYSEMYGTSVGALNVAFLSMFKDEKEGIIELEKFWLKIREKDVYKRWFPFGKLHGLWKNSIFNSKPLIKLVNDTVDMNKVNSNNRRVGVGTVNINTGKYKMFYNDHPDFVNAVLASSSFPIAFKPIEIEGCLYSDGGLKHVAPISAALETNNPIDLVLTYEKNRKYLNNKSNKSVLHLALNSLLYMRQEIEDSDITMTKLYNDLVMASVCKNKKFADICFYHPITELKQNSLSFNHNDIVYLINLGYEMAKKEYSF